MASAADDQDADNAGKYSYLLQNRQQRNCDDPRVRETPTQHLCGRYMMDVVMPNLSGYHERLDGTHRPYKMAASAGYAYEELMREANKGWRRKGLVEAFMRFEKRESRCDS